MQQTIKAGAICLWLLTFSQCGFAGPWFTGPILAPAGHTVPRGHTNLEMYGIDVQSSATYDQSGNIIHIPHFQTVVANPILTHGFTDWLDVQLTLPYAFNSTRGQNYNRISDVSTAVGIQLVEQNGAPHRADVRVLLQETFPTGRYEFLNADALGTDSTGLGCYQTQIGLNLQYLREIYDSHYLRSRLIVAHVFYGPTEVHGLNSYGGTSSTRGKIETSSETNFDLAFEYTLTKNWVAVMEGAYSKGTATRFNGILSLNNIDGPTAHEGLEDYWQTSLAPAIEYNFNGNIGLIGGVWFPVNAKNSPYFMTYVLALNAYW